MEVVAIHESQKLSDSRGKLYLVGEKIIIKKDDFTDPLPLLEFLLDFMLPTTEL